MGGQRGHASDERLEVAGRVYDRASRKRDTRLALRQSNQPRGLVRGIERCHRPDQHYKTGGHSRIGRLPGSRPGRKSYIATYIDPATPQIQNIVESINFARQQQFSIVPSPNLAANPNQPWIFVPKVNPITGRTNNVFEHLGDVLSAPGLTVQSPFLNTATTEQKHNVMTDRAMEYIPQQILRSCSAISRDLWCMRSGNRSSRRRVRSLRIRISITCVQTIRSPGRSRPRRSSTLTANSRLKAIHIRRTSHCTRWWKVLRFYRRSSKEEWVNVFGQSSRGDETLNLVCCREHRRVLSLVTSTAICISGPRRTECAEI